MRTDFIQELNDLVLGIPQTNLLIIKGADNLISEEQTSRLIEIIKSEGKYKDVFVAGIDPNSRGGSDGKLTGGELVRYIIKFLATSNPDYPLSGVIIISNG